MKCSLLLLGAVICCAVVTGCLSGTSATIREFDAQGNMTKETVSSESVVKNLVESTKNKTVIVWESGWMGYISASTATVENPTPTVKMFAGKSDKGMISALPTQNWNGIGEIISATRQDLVVSADGFKSTGAKSEIP